MNERFTFIPGGLRTPEEAAKTPDSERAIRVVLANQYGQEVIKPACPKAELFCEMVGTKTLTRRTIDQIKRLGYTVEVIPTQPKEL